MHDGCKLSIIDEELDKRNRTCVKYSIWCNGEQSDKEQCPDWAILQIVPVLESIAHSIDIIPLR